VFQFRFQISFRQKLLFLLFFSWQLPSSPVLPSKTYLRKCNGDANGGSNTSFCRKLIWNLNWNTLSLYWIIADDRFRHGAKFYPFLMTKTLRLENLLCRQFLTFCESKSHESGEEIHCLKKVFLLWENFPIGLQFIGLLWIGWKSKLNKVSVESWCLSQYFSAVVEIHNLWSKMENRRSKVWCSWTRRFSIFLSFRLPAR
jgi:hypothetical protein